MNHREPTSEPQGPGRTFPCLALLLLPFLLEASALAAPLPPVQAGLTRQKPYLVALGSPQLRFQEPVAAADPAVRPAKPGAPLATLTDLTDENTPDSIPPLDEMPSHASTESSVSSDLDSNGPSATDTAPSTSARNPRPILPDEMRPEARPEDFLPFFQIPAAQSGDITVFGPVPRAPATPAPLSNSSATYTQSPR
jgi:hypothetical protein